MTLRVPHDRAIQIGQDIAEAWRRWFDSATSLLNTEIGQIATAVQQTRLINAGAGLKGGGDLTEDRFLSLYSFVGATASLPAGGNSIGDWAYATDACNSGESTGSGTGCAVTWSGGAWRIPGVSAAVSA